MTHRSVDVMLSRPGIYMVVTPFAVGLNEVDTEGRCYELTLDDYRRDGELRPGGWKIENITAILGPFARQP